MTFDPTIAPPGYVARETPAANVETRPCEGCGFWADHGTVRECTKASPVSCMPYRRKDRASVIFVKARAA